MLTKSRTINQVPGLMVRWIQNVLLASQPMRWPRSEEEEAVEYEEEGKLKSP